MNGINVSRIMSMNDEVDSPTPGKHTPPVIQLDSLQAVNMYARLNRTGVHIDGLNTV